MDKHKVVKYHLEFQVIADYLNQKLSNHPDYIDDSYIYICGMQGSKLIIDVIDIDVDLSLSNKIKQFILELMSNIANDSNQRIEEMYKNIISKKTFPQPMSSYNSV
jgi:hypothetical protein